MFGQGTEWTPRAALLAEVLYRYESTLCPDCSQPGLLAYDPLNTGHFSVDDSLICLGCEALAHYKSDPWPGTKMRIVSDIDAGG